MTVYVTQANRDRDHEALVKLAKRSRYISAFGNIMFSSPAAYEKGWIRKAVVAETDEIVGFTCVRHKTRQPETVLYFIMVKPEAQGRGVGRELMADLEEQTPHERIALKVEKDNSGAIAFYERLGYVVESTNEYGGRGVLMAKRIVR